MAPLHELNYGFAGDVKYGNYYRHSGKLNLGGVFGALVVGSIAAFAMGWVYMFSDVFIPVPKLNAIICGLFGVALCFIPAAILEKMKVRNIPVSVAVVGVVAMCGLYTSWVAWEWWSIKDAVTDVTFVQLFIRPDAVLRTATAINDVGTWRMSNTDKENTKGVFLWIIWAAEALTIFGLPLGMAWGTMRMGRPFCEKCDQWCPKPPRVVRRSVVMDGKLLSSALEGGNFGYVTTLQKASGDQYLEFLVYRCQGCNELTTLTVRMNKIKRDRKGVNRGITRTTFVNKLLISDEQLAIVTQP